MDEATRISLKDQFNSLLVQAIEGRRGGMALMRVLEELDFYNSPASAKHHLNVPGQREASPECPRRSGDAFSQCGKSRPGIMRQDAAVCKMQ